MRQRRGERKSVVAALVLLALALLVLSAVWLSGEAPAPLACDCCYGECSCPRQRPPSFLTQLDWRLIAVVVAINSALISATVLGLISAAILKCGDLSCVEETLGKAEEGS